MFLLFSFMDVEKKVQETIGKYKLLDKNEKIVVALSGGKDSASVLYILHKLGYDVCGLMIDLGFGNWSKKNRKNMKGFCSKLGIKFHVVDLEKELGWGMEHIKDVLKKKKNLTGCSVCGVIKKWLLNKWAKKLKADKIVTGHNMDDECQTVLMNFLKGNVFLGLNSTPATGYVGELDQKCPPKSQTAFSSHPLSNGLINFESHKNRRAGASQSKQSFKGFVQRVKPLFFIPESEILKYAKEKRLPVLYEKCPCAFLTYRVETREWLNKIGDGEKLKVVEGFQKLIPKLRKKYGSEIKICKICGEPATWDVCNACKIFQCLK